MASLALALSFLEHLLPPLSAAVPGIKMGLANIAIVFTLYRFGLPSATAVSLIRLLCASFLFGGFTSFAYGLSGAVLSLSVMALLKKTDWFSPVGVSVSGAIFHNIGQILTATLLLGRSEIWYYLIVLSATGLASGLVVGILGALLVKRLAPEKT